MTKLFHPKCYELAGYFLDDVESATEAQRNDLASAIQQAIEDWLEDQDTAAGAAYAADIDNRIDERRESGRQF